MAQDKANKNLTIRIPPELQKPLAMKRAATGIPLQHVALSALQEWANGPLGGVVPSTSDKKRSDNYGTSGYNPAHPRQIQEWIAALKAIERQMAETAAVLQSHTEEPLAAADDSEESPPGRITREVTRLIQGDRNRKGRGKKTA